MMIDWVTARIPLAHYKPIHGGNIRCIDGYGEIEYSINRRLSVLGSHSSTITIRTLHTGPEGEIEFSGNPVKFLKGHNLYGSTDIIELMKHTLEKVFRALKVVPTPANWHAIHTGSYMLTRVDLNKMIKMRSLADVLSWIRATSHASRSRHKSGGVLKGDTLYWGHTSRRWAMKVYAKGQEISVKGHELSEGLPSRDLLTRWAQDKLRWELVIRGPELREHGISTAAAFAKADLNALFDTYKSRIVMPDNAPLMPNVLTTLPRNLRSTYALWNSGEDLRQAFSKNTYYRYRGALLKHGIDISIVPT